MLKKLYCHSGVFPDYGNTGKALTLFKETGVPAKKGEPRCGKQVFNIRHGLEGEIGFYSVTGYYRHKLIAMSDEYRTRYYWLGGVRHFTLVIDEPSTTYEEAWIQLFEALVFNQSADALKLHNFMGEFFTDMFEELYLVDYRRTLVGKVGKKRVEMLLERHHSCSQGFLDVTVGMGGQQVRASRPILQQIKHWL